MGIFSRAANLLGFRSKGVRDVSWDDSTQWRDMVATETSGGINFSVANTKYPNLTPMEQYAQSVAVNSAVNTIATQISKAKVRLFARNGEEINGGPLFDILRCPAPKVTTRKFIREVVSWYNIAGKYAVRVGERGQDGFPDSLVVLNPYKLRVHRPITPRSPGDVVVWKYLWCDGKQEDIRGDFLAYDRMFNPDPNSIDGLSPLVVGGINVTASVAAEKYNKSAFENGAIPSHLIVLPEGTPRQHREDFERRYRAEYSTHGNNAHKVMVVAGKDVDVKPLEQSFQDGAFMEMLRRADLKVSQLFRIPAINAGLYDKTRFDTANEERKLFLEETLMPECEAISECLQQQVVDVHYRFSKFTVARPRKPGKAFASKSLERQFEKAVAERGESPIIVLIDTDTLPVANDVALSKAEFAIKMREAYMISPRKAEEWTGLDFDDERPERDEIWASGTNIVCITKPELNQQLTPGVGAGAGGKPGDPAKPGGAAEKPKPKPKKELTDADRLRKTQLKTLIHKLRTLTLERMAAENTELWSLSDADSLNKTGDAVLAAEIRKARYHLRRIIEGEGNGAARLDAAKAWFDSRDGEYIRRALGMD